MVPAPRPTEPCPPGPIWVQRSCLQPCSPRHIQGPGGGSKDGGSRGLLRAGAAGPESSPPHCHIQTPVLLWQQLPAQRTPPAALCPAGQSSWVGSPVPLGKPSGLQPPPAQAGSGSRARCGQSSWMHEYRQGQSPPSQGCLTCSCLSRAHKQGFPLPTIIAMGAGV